MAAATFGTRGGIQQHLPAARGDVLFQVRGGQGLQCLFTGGIALEEDIEEAGEAVPHDAPLEIAGDKDDKQHAGQQLEQGEEAHQCRGLREELG